MRSTPKIPKSYRIQYEGCGAQAHDDVIYRLTAKLERLTAKIEAGITDPNAETKAMQLEIDLPIWIETVEISKRFNC